MKSILKYWLPLLIWLGLIFLDSTDLMSAQHTSRFIVPLLHWLNPNISPEATESLHFIIRKCAHVGEYAILALLLFRVAGYMTNLGWSMPMLSLTIWSVCLFVAVTDEFHQTFVPSRGPSIRDIAIDSSGSIVGLLIAAVVAWRRLKPGQTGRGRGEVQR
ncbi:MAG TPA: VanZ family protein [Candidatus Udaeobacter sp.]|jgi:VanZ family protein|nr:VanZ family protein [Candidatus Udaeobacter sp.]